MTDCVIACPSYFDDAQRRALLTAAKLAELKVLRILEEPTAVALCYGILRPLPENETQRVVFVDVGYASTQVAVVDFVKGKLSVRYKAANPFVGGREFDRALYEHFRSEWQSKHNVDIETLPKQKLKLLRACKRTKKLLTGNKDSLWTLDCFHNVCIFFKFALLLTSYCVLIQRTMISKWRCIGQKWRNYAQREKCMQAYWSH